MHSLEATAAPEQRLRALLDFTQGQIHISHEFLSVSFLWCDLWALSFLPLAWPEDPSSTQCEELEALVVHLDQNRLHWES